MQSFSFSFELSHKSLGVWVVFKTEDFKRYFSCECQAILKNGTTLRNGSDYEMKMVGAGKIFLYITR